MRHHTASEIHEAKINYRAMKAEQLGKTWANLPKFRRDRAFTMGVDDALTIAEALNAMGPETVLDNGFNGLTAEQINSRRSRVITHRMVVVPGKKFISDGDDTAYHGEISSRIRMHQAMFPTHIMMGLQPFIKYPWLGFGNEVSVFIKDATGQEDGNWLVTVSPFYSNPMRRYSQGRIVRFRWGYNFSIPAKRDLLFLSK